MGTRLKEIKQAQQTDETCKTVAHYRLTEWPEKHGLRPGTSPHWQVRTERYLKRDLLIKGERIVIPQVLRGEIMNKLHEGHQGVSKCCVTDQESIQIIDKPKTSRWFSKHFLASNKILTV